MKHLLSLFLSVVIIGLWGCKPSVPSEYISPNKMADILYEYHLAEAICQDQKHNDADLLAYKHSILQRHHVTTADFDSSLVYYSRHADALNEIYQKVVNKMENQLTKETGIRRQDSGVKNKETGGDTVDVWTGQDAITLLPYKPYNVYTFNIDADSTYLPGDLLTLGLDAQYLWQQGVRNAQALLCARLSNDSVVTRTTNLYSSYFYTLNLSAGDSLSIKSVYGAFYLNTLDETSDIGIHVVVIREPYLLRIRKPKTQPQAPEYLEK